LREALAQIGQPLQRLGGGLEVEPAAFQTRQKHVGDKTRIAIRREADEEPGPQVIGLLFQPVAVLVDDGSLAAEPSIQRPPRAARGPAAITNHRLHPCLAVSGSLTRPPARIMRK